MKKVSINKKNKQTLDLLKKLWANKFKEAKTKWDKKPGWPAKLVETRFTLNGIDYTISSTDIGLSDSNWDQGFMESIQNEIEKDLKVYGATSIVSRGFLD